MIKKQKAKELFLRDKSFLKELYKAGALQIKSFLNYASDSQLKTLVYYIHFLASGLIPFKKSLFKILKRLDKIPFLHKHFSKVAVFRKFLKEDRKHKVSLLSKLQTVFRVLLQPLFKE